jgi:hypothetical protein
MALTFGKPILHRLVYELRYDYGYTYLDRAGATINDILKRHPGWVNPQVNPQTGVLRNVNNEMVFNFGPRKLDLSQAQSQKVAELAPIGEFASLAKELTATVLEWLELAEFTRMGFRAWRLYPMGSSDEAKRAVISLGVLSTGLIGKMELGSLSEVSWAAVVENHDVTTRIAVSAIEQNIELDPATLKAALDKAHKHDRHQRRIMAEQVKAQRTVANYPQFAVLVDMDHFVQDPPRPEGDGIAEFITTQFEWGTGVSAKVMEARS